MPTYTYECKKCGSQQDEFHMMSAAPAVKCGSCGSARMRKRPGAGAGIIFKGSGFYETDYKRNGANGKEPNGKSDSQSGSSNDSAKPGEQAASSKSSESKGSESKGNESKKTVPAAAN